MKNFLLPTFILAILLFGGCKNEINDNPDVISDPEVSQTASEQSDSTYSSADFYFLPEPALGVKVVWGTSNNGQAKSQIKAYRNHSNLKLPVLLENGQVRNLHGINIPIEDILDLLGITDHCEVDSKIKGLYLMPAVREENKREYVTMILSRVIDEDKRHKIDVNAVYNQYRACPPYCPDVDWAEDLSGKYINDSIAK